VVPLRQVVKLIWVARVTMTARATSNESWSRGARRQWLAGIEQQGSSAATQRASRSSQACPRPC